MSSEVGTKEEVVVVGILVFVNLLKFWLNCPNALDAHAARRNEDKRMLNEWLPTNGLQLGMNDSDDVEWKIVSEQSIYVHQAVK